MAKQKSKRENTLHVKISDKLHVLLKERIKTTERSIQGEALYLLKRGLHYEDYNANKFD